MSRPKRDSTMPPNLTMNGGYFQYRNPVTGIRYSLGKDRAKAESQARAANAHIEKRQTLVTRIESPHKTVADFMPVYLAALKQREISDVTAKNRARASKAVAAALGALQVGARQEYLSAVTKACAEFLTEYVKQDKRRMATYMRSVLLDFFSQWAATWGLPLNPITPIRLPAPKVKRQRLELHEWQAIYAKSQDEADPWFTNALLLAMLTAQRREDVANMRFKDIVDGKLMVEQRKTGARLLIPLKLRMDAVGASLGDAIAQCRDGVLSHHLIHHHRPQGQAKRGQRVHPQTYATEFARLRDLCGIVAPEGKDPPSFHEIRSLAARTYKAEGRDPQNLLGHKDAETTAVYLDGRQQKWVEVAA